MQENQAASGILNSTARRKLISKVLSVLLLVVGLLVTTGILTNLMGEFHPRRFVFNVVGLVCLMVAFLFVLKGKLLYGIQTILGSAVLVFGFSTLVNGGVLVPNYVGFFVLLVIASAFSSRRSVLIIFGVFVLVGGLSLIWSSGESHFPTPFRYWTMYVLFGLVVTSVLVLTREAFGEALAKVAAREALLSSIFVSTSDPLVVFDVQKNISHMNPSAEELDRSLASIGGVGLCQTDVINLETSICAPFLDHIDFDAEVSTTLSINMTVDHHQRWFLVTVSPQLLKGKSVGLVAFIRDVTDQHYLSQSQKMSAVGVLANGIAHDFNNMLGAISNSTEILSSSLDEDQLEHLAIIEEATRRSAELTENLMFFSRKRPARRKSVDLHAVLEDLACLLRRTVDKKVAIELDLAAASAMVHGDEGQIHSALMNLGINAAQAMPDGGVVSFRTREGPLTQSECANSLFEVEPGHFIFLDVQDEGMGMGPELLTRIFEPFFTTKDIGQGTGLGLSAVHGMVGSHQGGIDVKSEVGVGTTFRLFLPFNATKLSTGPVTVRPTLERSDIEARRILVIDDESLVRRALCRILKLMDFVSLGVESGEAAMTELRQEDGYDLVILDMYMPLRSGREVFYDLKTNFPDLPIILSSGFTPEHILEELVANGLAGVLTKPYSHIELREAIARALRTDDGPSMTL